MAPAIPGSLSEGAGNGCGGAYHSMCRPETATLRAIFIAPTKTQRFLHFTIQRTTLPQSRPLGVPAPSEREPGWGAYHSACRPETARLRAIFIAPTKLKSFYILPFIGGHSLSFAALSSSLREGAGNDGAAPFNRVLAKPEGYGRFSSPLRNSECFTFHHSTAPGF